MTFTAEHERVHATLLADILSAQMHAKIYEAAKSFGMSPSVFLTAERTARATEAKELAKTFAVLEHLACTVEITGAKPEHPYAFTIDDWHGAIKVQKTIKGVTLYADIQPYVWEEGTPYAKRRTGFVYRVYTDAASVLRPSQRRKFLSGQEDKNIMWGKFSFARYKSAVADMVIALNL